MIVILHPDADKASPDYQELLAYLDAHPAVQYRVHEVVGEQRTVSEIYLIGDTAALDRAEIEGFAVVERVVRVSREYRILGRHADDSRPSRFDYNGVTFSQDDLHVFAGLCAVSTAEHVDAMMRALAAAGQQCTRMGAYKPRTNPYSFQGHGKRCLPKVFELAGKYGIRVIAMEVTHEAHIAEIREALELTGRPTGVMLQIGTRNTQNFELLKCVGRQHEFPVLLKRGFGITLEESLNAAEYLASEGNQKVIFCLRGMKTNLGDPHRNLVDFAHIPAVKRLTRMPVAIDPSHSVGTRTRAPDEILDIFHATAQGVIAGANLVLVDFHPEPEKALVDGPQALHLDELEWFLEDVAIAREAYLGRLRSRAARTAGQLE
jgi:3-deoxy-7-phosphoheptulonate synthase